MDMGIDDTGQYPASARPKSPLRCPAAFPFQDSYNPAILNHNLPGKPLPSRLNYIPLYNEVRI